MRLIATRVEKSASWVSLVGSIRGADGRAGELYYRFPAEQAPSVVDCADPFLVALLPASMLRREPLELVPPVDGRLLANCERAAQILLAWNAAEFGFHPPRLTAQTRPAARGRGGDRIASLFSGGLDSYYSLAKWSRTAQRISHVLFIKGLEQPLDKTEDAEGAVALAEEGAALFGARLIRAETNLRTLFPELNYERSYQSAALASAALALSGGFKRLIFPSSFAYSQLVPWGSHPLLDGLWSSGRLEVVHDGAEARRVDKIAALAQHPEALARLRVCLENRSGPYNCGRCRKCVRTMLALEIMGVRRKAKLFPNLLPADIEARLAQDPPQMLNELIDAARSRGTTPELLRLLERALQRRERKDALRALIASSPVASLLWKTVKSLRPLSQARNVVVSSEASPFALPSEPDELAIPSPAARSAPIGNPP